MSLRNLVGGVVVLLIVLGVIGASFSYTIDQGERGVVLRNGAFAGTADPGFHLKAPWVDSVVKIPVTQQTLTWGSNGGADSSLQAYSQDQQPATMAVSVSYHVPPESVDGLYAQYRSVDGLATNLIARRLPQDLKTVFGQFTAVSVIQDRSRFNTEVQAAVQADIKGPVVIDSVQIENIDFSDAYEQSVENAMKARVEVQRLQQEQQQQEVQARITVIQAQAQADAQLAQRKAEAAGIQAIGEAQAAAIRARGDALKDNPDLVALEATEKWNGVLPATMVPGASLPFVNVAPVSRQP